MLKQQQQQQKQGKRKQNKTNKQTNQNQKPESSRSFLATQWLCSQLGLVGSYLKKEKREGQNSREKGR